MARQYYKDSTTGQMKPLGVKVEDTLPVGTEVDYDGQDIPEGWEEITPALPSAITVDLATIQTINPTVAYEKTQINLDRQVNKIGSKLSFDSTNHAIVVGSGVHHIEVSAALALEASTSGAVDRYILLSINNVSAALISSYLQLNGGSAYVKNYLILPYIISVSEGDKIILGTQSGYVETLKVRDRGTYITVKVID